MSVVTLTEFKDYLDFEREDARRDRVLEAVLRSTEQFVASEYRLQLEPLPALVNTGTAEAPVWADTADPVTVRRRVHANRFVRVPDAREVAAVTIDGTEVTEYELLPRPGREGGPYPRIEVFLRGAVVEVTGRFGFHPLPSDLRDFILSLAARRYKEGPAVGFADARAASDEYGDRIYFNRLPESLKAPGESYRVPSDRLGLP